MARSHVMVWTGTLLLACVAALVAANCSNQCTDTTFRGYASCLQNCGTNVAVTTCDCSATTCARCPGDNSCCQTCCNNKQCVCSNVNCQQSCNNNNNPCCSQCCQQQIQSQCNNCNNVNCQQPCNNNNNPCCSQCCGQQMQQSQCGSCAPGCQQQGSACSPCCQSTTTSTTTTTTTTSRPPIYPPERQVALPPTYVNVSLGNIAVNPANITILPANISLTPHITVVVNTSPVSQVYPSQYAGNVSLSIQQQTAPNLNCSNGRRRCCRVVLAPRYPCPPSMPCPPMERVGCGDQCAAITQQPMYYQPPPPPRPVYYPVYYPTYYYRPVYVYVPQTPQYFCSTGCSATPTWPFARCYGTDGPVPFSQGGMSSMPQYTSMQLGPYASASVAASAPFTNMQG